VRRFPAVVFPSASLVTFRSCLPGEALLSATVGPNPDSPDFAEAIGFLRQVGGFVEGVGAPSTARVQVNNSSPTKAFAVAISLVCARVR
jgi:hypothetical protein